MNRLWVTIALFALAAAGSSGAPDGHASFEGANGKIVFSSDRDGNAEIYAMDSNGENETNLTNNPASDIEPAWSPNGDKIAFASDREGGITQVFIMNADGSNVTKLTDDPAGAGGPSWSPDGQMIAYHGLESGNYDIYVTPIVFPDGRRITFDAAPETQPRWSPGGGLIAYVSEADGNPEIYVMDAIGAGATRLTDSPGIDKEISWETYGDRIAFASSRSGLFQVYVMDSDGTNVEQLTDDPAGAGAPAWSPDGFRLAFHSVRDGAHDIWVMDFDGTDQVRLTTSDATDFGPDWQALGGLRGDVNCDGRITSVDSLFLLRHIAFLPYALPSGCTPLAGTLSLVSRGSATLFASYIFDFDLGTTAVRGDVWWRTASDTERSLEPQPGAAVTNLGVVDFNSIEPAALRVLSYSNAPIIGNDDASNQLVTGDVFAVRTSEGNFAKVKVVSYGPHLELQWETYLGFASGDLNCSGQVDSVDALFALRFIAQVSLNLPPGCPQVGS